MTLPGKSKTIIVEPLKVPAPAPIEKPIEKPVPDKEPVKV
jgi:hypothetical protein